MLITHNQFDTLQGFFAHCYAVYHDDVKPDWGFWATQLDTRNIPWSVQNTVAVTAEDKSSISLYLRTHLSHRNITVN